MRILNVAYPLFPVTPGSGGGAEQILRLLEQGIVRAGHESIVIAAEGSSVSGELVASPAAAGEITDQVRREAQVVHRSLIEKVLQRGAIDVVHFHGLDFVEYVPHELGGHASFVTTLHLPLSWYPASIWQHSQIQYVCVSHSQAVTCPEHRVAVVPNGIDLGEWSKLKDKRTHLLLLARICPEKGIDIALRVAHQLDLPLIVAGPVHRFPYHEQYFAEKVKPLLDRKRVYVGPVGLEEKRKLLATARCLIAPSLAPETSSLVAMEAAASGTPVVALHSGALPEVVEHGRTGFIAQDETELLNAIRQALDQISEEECRKVAGARFNAMQMVSNYVRLYERLRLGRQTKTPEHAEFVA